MAKRKRQDRYYNGQKKQTERQITQWPKNKTEGQTTQWLKEKDRRTDNTMAKRKRQEDR